MRNMMMEMWKPEMEMMWVRPVARRISLVFGEMREVSPRKMASMRLNVL